MSGPELTVGRAVVTEMVTLAAIGIPGVARVARGGSRWRSVLAGSPVVTRRSDGAVAVRVWIVARPGQSLVRLADDVAVAVGSAVDRLLGLRLESVTVTVDGVGA